MASSVPRSPSRASTTSSTGSKKRATLSGREDTNRIKAPLLTASSDHDVLVAGGTPVRSPLHRRPPRRVGAYPGERGASLASAATRASDDGATEEYLGTLRQDQASYNDVRNSSNVLDSASTTTLRVGGAGEAHATSKRLLATMLEEEEEMEELESGSSQELAALDSMNIDEHEYLARSASPPVYLENDAAALIIRRGRYQSLRQPKAWHSRYVTKQLVNLLSMNGTRLQLDGEFNHLFGDPCPGEPKQLVVEFEVKGCQRRRRWTENQVVDLQSRSYDATAKRPQRFKDAIMPSSNLASYTDGNHLNRNRFELPHVLLRIVLSYLPIWPDKLNCSLVCKDWHRAIEELGLARHFAIGAPDLPGPDYSGYAPSFVEMIAARSNKNLEVFNLSGFSAILDPHLRNVLGHAYNLRNVDLTDCVALTDDSLAALGGCSRLEQLTLKRVASATDVTLLAVASGCRHLQRLDLSECPLITDRSLEAVSRGLHNLRALFLRENFQVTSYGVHCVASSLRNLRELSLWGLHRIRSDAFENFGYLATSLRSLSLEACHGIDDAAVIYFSRMSKELSSLISLNLKFCHRITDAAVSAIALAHPKLQHLNLCHVMKLTDAGIFDLVEHLRDLRSLDVSHCRGVSSRAIQRVSDECSELGELSLRGGSQYDLDTIQAVANAVSKKNGSLGLLDVRECDAIDFDSCLDLLNGEDEGFPFEEDGVRRGVFYR